MTLKVTLTSSDQTILVQKIFFDLDKQRILPVSGLRRKSRHFWMDLKSKFWIVNFSDYLFYFLVLFYSLIGKTRILMQCFAYITRLLVGHKAIVLLPLQHLVLLLGFQFVNQCFPESKFLIGLG